MCQYKSNHWWLTKHVLKTLFHFSAYTTVLLYQYQY